ncbi:hypothetical protein BSLG_004284 [Batrachochytrium salamandrivorans]|nr:hypothetical protein BSLG_004284 [Batrachochytrium salamandrivorans]
MHRPLADMARPTSLDEFYGQDTLIDNHPCCVNWLPPKSTMHDPMGSAWIWETTLARIIDNMNNLSKELGVYFKEMSATIHNVADVRKASDEARNHRQLMEKQSPLLPH